MTDVSSTAAAAVPTTMASTATTTASSSSSSNTNVVAGTTATAAAALSSSSYYLDERVVAKAALDAAEEQLQGLCAQHAGIFVAVERRGRATHSALEDFMQHVVAALDAVDHASHVLEQQQGEEPEQQPASLTHGDDGPETSSQATTRNRKNETAGDQHNVPLAVLSERHRVRRRTLLQHSSLLELLELPSLMDACVRSNLYEEALAIAVFANTLERRHGIISSSSTANENTDPSTDNNNNNSNIGNHKAPSANTVVAHVVAEIRSRQADLRRHLLHRLRFHVTMPECLEVVTALRRLNSIDLERQQAAAAMIMMTATATSVSSTSDVADNDFNRSSDNHALSSSPSSSSSWSLDKMHAAMEMSLQVDFLEARDVWLDTPIAAAGTITGTSAASLPLSLAGGSGHGTSMSSSASEPLLDAIERYRTRVFEVATQFNAIFRTQTRVSTMSASLLSMWTARRVQAFCVLLSSHLYPANITAPALTNTHALTTTTNAAGSASAAAVMGGPSIASLNDAAAVRDAFEAAVFFASSMGRLGADFSCLLPALFEPKVHDLVVHYWNEGVQQLQSTLKICRENAIASPLIAPATGMVTGGNSNSEASANTSRREMATTTTTTVGVDGLWLDDDDDAAKDGWGDPQPAPRVLLTVPPLARLVNAILSGLNELRRCLLPGLLLPERLRRSLQDVVFVPMKRTLQEHERVVYGPGSSSIMPLQSGPDIPALRHIAILYQELWTGTIEPYLHGSLEAAIGNIDQAKYYHGILYSNMKKKFDAEQEKLRQLDAEAASPPPERTDAETDIGSPEEEDMNSFQQDFDANLGRDNETVHEP